MKRQQQTVPTVVEEAARDAGLYGHLHDVPRRGGGRVHLFENGMVMTRGLSRRHPTGTATRRWEDVASLGYAIKSSMEHDVPRGSVVTCDVHVLDFRFSGERPCHVVVGEAPVRTLDADFFERGLRSDPPPENLRARHAVVRVRRAVAETQAPAVLRALRAGASIEFGPWQATEAGIVADGRIYPWEQVSLPILGLRPSPDRKHASHATVVVYTSADRSTWLSATDTEVPDLALLCLVTAERAPDAHRESYEAMFP